MKRLSISERLALNKFEVDHEEPHIVLKRDICRSCSVKPCTFVCPAGLYTWNGEEINFDYAGCLECGACRVVCPKGALTWNYPRGSFGVIFRYG
ncbi:MAG: ferredoxin family protein [Firmicutes bacterium]|nr:ferredoxin family protein [Bacillota bacterium]NPV30020.1 ferredoxin family protein [Bacillota bacterium]